MSDMNERIKKSVKEHSYPIIVGRNSHDVGMTVEGFMQVIDEELAKEPQEEPNIPLECVDGSCPMALSEEYEERGMDVVHSCEECPYQPQVQPIVRNVEEIAAMLWRLDYYMRKQSKQDWIEWLTKKEV